MHPRWFGGDSDNCQMLDGGGAELRKWNAHYSNHKVEVGVAPVQIYLETYLETCLIIARGEKKNLIWNLSCDLFYLFSFLGGGYEVLPARKFQKLISSAIFCSF